MRRAKRGEEIVGVRVAVAMQCSEDGEEFVIPAPYMRFIEQCGAQTVAVSPTTPMPQFEALMGRCSGFLIPGGNDIQPFRYGKTLEGPLDDPVPQRDEFELAAVQWAVEHGVPVLGICRGAQVLNVALGGTLRQIADGSEQHVGSSDAQLSGRFVDHWPCEQGGAFAHEIGIQPHTLAGAVLKAPRAFVNSLHHQAIDACGQAVVVDAFAPDGVVEAIHVDGHPFALGVQWHPERISEQRESRAIGRAFVQACSRCAAR